jgi:hypothetical protein
MKTINASRRKILAGVAAAPLVALPNALSALATLAPSDPIFQALDVFRLAKSAYMEAKDAHKEIENVNFEVAFPFKFRATMGEETKVVSSLTQLTEWLDPFAPNYRDGGIREIGVLAEKFYGVKLPEPPPVELAKVKKWNEDSAAVIAAFERAKKEYDAKYSEAGLDVAQERIEVAWVAFEEAEDAVLRTKPTTAAGGVALVHFCAEYLAEYDACGQVAAALINATAALANGSEVMISKKLASAYAKNLPADEARSDQPEELLQSYQTWLFNEFHAMSDELSPEGRHRRGDFTWCNNAGDRFHWVPFGEKPKPLPSTRAAAVLAAVGCDWKEEEASRHV